MMVGNPGHTVRIKQSTNSVQITHPHPPSRDPFTVSFPLNPPIATLKLNPETIHKYPLVSKPLTRLDTDSAVDTVGKRTAAVAETVAMGTGTAFGQREAG